jgi:predicted metal-dependent hydrolase
MKKTALGLAIILTLSVSALAQEIPLSYVPADHQGIIHINSNKILSALNQESFEKRFLELAASTLASYDARYTAIKKVFTEILPKLKEAGFDFYRDLKSIVISGNILQGKNMLIRLEGNFSDEAVDYLFTKLFKMEKVSDKKYSRGNAVAYKASPTTLLVAPNESIISASLKAKKTGNNILRNPKFASVYAKSVKNKAINIIATVGYQMPHRPRMRNSQGMMRQRRGGANSMGMIMMFLQNINGINISVDIPSMLSVHVRVFCKEPNTAAMIGNLLQQQIQLLPANLNNEIIKLDKKLASLQAKIETNPGYKNRIHFLKHKKAVLLILTRGIKSFRVVTMGNNIYFDYYWPRNVIDEAMMKAELGYTLRDLLR